MDRLSKRPCRLIWYQWFVSNIAIVGSKMRPICVGGFECKVVRLRIQVQAEVGGCASSLVQEPICTPDFAKLWVWYNIPPQHLSHA
jgi:hypothetical protein